MVLALNAKHVCMSFGGIPALADVNLILDRGDVIALIGPNGAGKSTLLKIIAGSLRPDSGSIMLGDRELIGMSPAETARLGIVRVFQKPRVFSDLTVWDNALLGCLAQAHWSDDLARREVEGLLRSAGLLNDRALLAKSLSFGKKRVLEMARAIATRPQILLLDEPAAGLSPSEQASLIEYLRDSVCSKGIGLIFVEHSAAVIFALATKVVILTSGTKVYEGAADADATKEAFARHYSKTYDTRS